MYGSASIRVEATAWIAGSIGRRGHGAALSGGGPRQLCQGCAQQVHPLALTRAGDDGLRQGTDQPGEPRLQLQHQRLELGLADQVGLGQHELERHRGLAQQLEHLLVRLLGPVPRVDQQAHPQQARPPAQIGEHQPGPALDHVLGRLGEAVARQIDQDQPAAQVEQVDLLGPARRVGGARQAGPAGQRVDQARLADVRSARERDLRQPRRRQLVELDHPAQEGRLLREQLAADLEALRIIEPIRVGHVHSLTPPSPGLGPAGC